MSDFSNNLRVGDKVFDVELKLNGLVSIEREKDRLTSVIFDGFVKSKRRDVAGLRLIVNGKPEDVAPFDGELPPLEKPVASARQPSKPVLRLVPVTPIETLQAKRDANNLRRDTIQKEFVALGAENVRIENAIAALTA